MDVLTDFPYLISQSVDGNQYSGFMSICNQLYRLEVLIPRCGQLKRATIKCDWKLRQILGNCTNIIQQRLHQCETLHSFLKEICCIAERQLERESRLETRDTSFFCSQLVDHIEQLGWDKLVFVDENFKELHLLYRDMSDRDHVLKLYISTKYPQELPKYSVQLPTKFDLHWTTHSSLIHVYSQFTSVVDCHREFLNLMTEIDTNTWVLEPEKPTFSATHRRIAINASVSVQITVDPANPRVLPDCKFLGSDQAVAPLRQSMNSNVPLWREEKGLVENLQQLLNITFPSPTNSTKEEFSVECGICYTYTMEAEIPDEVCNEPRCQQAFHKSCLVQWLRALSSSRQSFNTIFGNCPYCEKSMTVKMTDR